MTPKATMEVYNSIEEWGYNSIIWNHKFNFQCGGGESSLPQQTMLWMLTGCPTVQLNSDPIYLEIASDFTGKGLSPRRPAPIPLQISIAHPGYYWCFSLTSYKLELPITPFNSGCQSQVQVFTCVYVWLVTSWRSPQHSLGLINLPEWLRECREIFHLLDYYFFYKGYNSGTARGKRCIGQVWGKATELIYPL